LICLRIRRGYTHPLEAGRERREEEG